MRGPAHLGGPVISSRRERTLEIPLGRVAFGPPQAAIPEKCVSPPWFVSGWGRQTRYQRSVKHGSQSQPARELNRPVSTLDTRCELNRAGECPRIAFPPFRESP
jgi:hypothetical protein